MKSGSAPLKKRNRKKRDNSGKKKFEILEKRIQGQKES